MENGKVTCGLGIGILMGAAAGLAVGILYAPNSGRKTRVLIDKKLHEATHTAEKIMDEAREKAEGIVQGAKSKIGG